MDESELTQKIKIANRSWSARVSNLVRDVQYDYEADILYINYGKISEAFSIPADDPDGCVYLRIDADSYEIIGIEILTFKRLFLERHTDAREIFENLFEVFGNDDWRFQILPGADEQSSGVTIFTPASKASVGYFSAYLPKIAPDLIPA